LNRSCWSRGDDERKLGEGEEVLEERSVVGDRKLINREGVMNDGVVEVEVVRTAEMMLEVELDAIIRLERRDAASVVQGSIRGMIRGLGLVRSKGAE
jgi:hypothetical protein